MRVKMTVDISGGWSDSDGSHEWPPHGEEVDLPDEVATDLLRLGHATGAQSESDGPESVDKEIADAHPDPDGPDDEPEPKE